jgi:hypothetical protein
MNIFSIVKASAMALDAVVGIVASVVPAGKFKDVLTKADAVLKELLAAIPLAESEHANLKNVQLSLDGDDEKA